jgi:hypothetical protein
MLATAHCMLLRPSAHRAGSGADADCKRVVLSWQAVEGWESDEDEPAGGAGAGAKHHLEEGEGAEDEDAWEEL